MDKQCLICQKMFFAKRSTAKYCSAACKLKNSRQVNEEPIIKKEAEPLIDEWFNSAETKTQAEIKAHYTLENFPMAARYYSANGGGSGRLSPYTQTDPRHRAYTI